MAFTKVFKSITFSPEFTEPPFIDLIPEFDLPVPTARDDFGGFMRVPQSANAHLVVSFDPVVELGGLPVPDIELSICVT